MASKINRALYTPRLWFGIQKIYAVTILCAEILVLALGSFWVKVGCSIFFAGLWRWLDHLNKVDYIFFTVLRRHLMRPNYYRAYSKFGSKYNKKVNYKVAGK